MTHPMYKPAPPIHFQPGDHCGVLGEPFTDGKPRRAVVVRIIHLNGSVLYKVRGDDGRIGYAKESEMKK